MVRIGGSALGSAWRQSAARRDRPFARAVRMKSSFSASTSAERVTRVRIAACTRPSASAGSSSAAAPRAGSPQPGKPPAGNSRQCTAKTSTSTMPNQKFGTASPNWLSRHHRRVAGAGRAAPRRRRRRVSATTAAIAIASSASGALTASRSPISGAIGEL